MSNYDEDQATAVLEACGRAAHEAWAAVRAAQGDPQPGWHELPEASRNLNRGSAALVLDLLAKADDNGATAESADWVVADFARVTGLSQTTANLFVSVVAAVKATLDKEMA